MNPVRSFGGVIDMQYGVANYLGVMGDLLVLLTGGLTG